MYYKTFISAKDLLSKDLSDFIIFDCSFSLLKPEEAKKEYKKSHIPGAFYADLDKDLSAPVSKHSGKHPLPDIKIFHQFLLNHNVNNDSQVIVYDKSNGSFAARMWWLLRLIGFENCAILEGGLASWVNAGGVLDETVLPYQKGNVEIKKPLVSYLTIDQLKEEMEKNTLLLDARDPKRYSGQIEPIYSKAGHIPGAVNRFLFDNFDKDGHLRDKNELFKEFNQICKHKPKEAISYCGSGVTACLQIAVMEHIGIGCPRLYVGSWSQWISFPENKIEVSHQE